MSVLLPVFPGFSTRSLRFQLVTYASMLLLFIGLLSMLAVKRYAYQTAQIAFDRPLANSALQILEQVRFEHLQVSVDLPFSAFAGLSDSPRDKVFYAVVINQDEFITGYASLLSDTTIQSHIQRYPVKLEIKPHFFSHTMFDEYVRFALVSRSVNTSEGAQVVSVLVGQTVQARTHWEKDLSDVAFKLLIGVISCALVVILVLIAMVLKPLNVINQKIASRSNVDLTPIDMDAPEEVSHLIETVNTFMSQLDDTLTNLKNFTGEAAHQLKTPLAGMRAQVGLILSRDHNEATARSLANVLKACDVLERTIDQLLNHATIKHRYRSVEPQWVNINQLTASVCRSLAMNALAKEIELSYDADTAFSVRGDAFALEQMLTNLIENAIKYSPASSRVEVEVSHMGSKAVVVIRDFGPGISDADKPLVFDRFYRISGTDEAGTGLGMSIAADVAKKMQAVLLLKDSVPTGLTVEIQFPYTAWQEVSE